MITAKIGRRGQLVLPREIRERIQVDEGDRIAFVDRGEEILIQPIRSTLRDMRGSVPVTGRQDFDKIRESVKQKRNRNA